MIKIKIEKNFQSLIVIRYTGSEMQINKRTSVCFGTGKVVHLRGSSRCEITQIMAELGLVSEQKDVTHI